MRYFFYNRVSIYYYSEDSEVAHGYFNGLRIAVLNTADTRLQDEIEDQRSEELV